MSTWLPPAKYFAAFAAAARDDEDLRHGTHLRLLPSPRIGFPLAPFLVWSVPAPVYTDPVYAWFDARGQAAASLDLDAAGNELTGWLTAPLADDARVIGIEARFAVGQGELAVVDRSDAHVACARSRPPWVVGAPECHRVRLRGRGPVEVRVHVLSPGIAFEHLVGQAPAGSLSLPVEGDAPWYARGEGVIAALKRATDAAPLRYTPPDRPDGPFDSLSRDAETARVEALRVDLDDEVKALVSDPDVPPRAVRFERVWPAQGTRPWQQASGSVQNTLLLKALDPGVGRYLGLMTRHDELPPDPPPAGDAPGVAWLAAGLYAVGPEMRFELPDPDDRELRLIHRLSSLLPEVARTFALATQRHGLTIRAFVAPAFAAPPADRPSAPNLQLGEAGWQREPSGASTKFRQLFVAVSPPLAGLASLARFENGAWSSRHGVLELAAGADPAMRARTRLLGTRHDLVLGRVGLLDDRGIDAAGVPWRYRVSLADLFGRFGAPADVAVPEPARPGVPRPAPETRLALASPASGWEPEPAGRLHVRVPVPALVDLGAGARPLARVVATFDGATQDAPAPPAGGTVELEFPLPALAPAESRRPTLACRFENDQGTAGESAVESLDLCDPRSPRVPVIAGGITWTTRPGPSEDVELAVRVKGIANQKVRVYLGDARGLGIAQHSGGQPRSRAAIANDGVQIGRTGGGARDAFRVVSDPPLTIGADGTTHFDLRLPRTLQTVQFLRFVPLTERGVEAPFGACPLLPVAVPSDRAPPAPRVEVVVNAATGVVRVRVVADGLDVVELASAEPGLLQDPPAADARAPEFRLRRASGAVPEPMYAREVARGVLARTAGQFTGAFDETTPLLPYVRYFYWGEVRLPPERRLVTGIDAEVDPVSDVEPLQAAQREDAPREFSAPSAAALAVHVPAEIASLADAAATLTATVGAGTTQLQLTVEGGPTLSARALAQYRVQIHTQLDGGAWQEAPAVADLVGGALSWATTLPSAMTASARIALVLVDPVGRESAPRFVTAANA